MLKIALREILSTYIPPELTERPKRGFGVPLDRWLRGPLREWGADLLATETLQRQGLLHPATVTQLWQDHQTGIANNATKLWNLLTLQSWLNQQQGRYSTSP